MKYTQEIIINLPIEKVLQIFYNPASQEYSHPDLAGSELISGKAGEEGAVTKLKFKNFDFIETITKKSSPAEFVAEYKTSGLEQTVKNSFIESGPDKTIYRREIDSRPKSLMLKTIALIAPGFYKNQTYKYLEKIKEFAEKKS